MSEPDNAAEPRKAGLPIAKLAAAAVVLIGLIALGSQAGSVLRQFTTWVDGLGFWAPLVFVAGYALAVARALVRLAKPKGQRSDRWRFHGLPPALDGLPDPGIARAWFQTRSPGVEFVQPLGRGALLGRPKDERHAVLSAPSQTACAPGLVSQAPGRVLSPAPPSGRSIRRWSR